MGELLTSEKVSWVLRLLFAQSVIALLFTLNLVNFSIPHTGDIRPMFLLMAIYYWAVFRPTLIPPVMTFVWGLLFDSLSGIPLGLNALLFLLIQWVVRDQRLYLMGQSFMMLWAGFAVTAIIYGWLQWLIFALLHFTFPEYQPAVVTVLLSIGLFPVVSLILIFTHRLMPPELTRGLR